MDIAKLGVEIDPDEAVRGSRKVERELDDLGHSAEKNLGKLDKASERAGRSTQRMGGRAKMAFGSLVSGAIGVLDAFGLMNNGLGNMVRRGEGAVRGVGQLTAAHRQGAAAAADQAGGLDDMAASAAGARVGARGLMATLGPLIGILLAVAAAVVGVVAGVKLLTTAFRLIRAGIPKAAELEQSTVAFAVLLGNADEARERIKLLKDFAARTPFQLPGIIETSRTLQIFTDGALATEEGLKLVGDAAAGAGRPINEVSMWVGRLYAALKGGQPVGEATMRLLEMGLILPKTKSELDKAATSANKNGQAFEELWGKAQEGLLRFRGSMELQSKTFNGLVSTLKDNWNDLLAELAAPINDALKPVLEDLIRLIQFLKPAAAAVGNLIGNSIKVVVQTIKSGELSRALGLALAAGIELGFNLMVKLFIFRSVLMGKALLKMLVGAFRLSVALFVNLITMGIALVAGLFTGEFNTSTNQIGKGFTGAMGEVMKVVATMAKNELGEAFDAVATIFQNAIFKVLQAMGDAVNKVIASAQGVPGLGGLKQVSPIAMPKAVDFFQPEPVSLGDLNRALDKMLPSGAQDRLKDFAADKLGDFNLANPGALDGALPKPVVPTDPTGEDPAAGAGKAGAAAKKAAEDAVPPVVELAREWGNLDLQLQNLAAGSLEAISFGMTDAFASIIDGSKSAGEAFSQMASQIIGDIIRMILQLTIQATIMKALGFPVGGGLGSFAAGIPALGGVAHGGSEPGTRGGLGARVMHGGGTGSSERPTILDRNETVLTRRRSEELEMELAAAKGEQAGSQGGSSQGVTIVNALDPQTVEDAIAANPNLIVNAVGRRKKQVKAILG